MATHEITFTTAEETLYQAYLTATEVTDEAVMLLAKNNLKTQILQVIKEKGIEKFNTLAVAEQIAFIAS